MITKLTLFMFGFIFILACEKPNNSPKNLDRQLSGIVFDQDSLPIEGVDISLNRSSQGNYFGWETFMSTRSDSAGKFGFNFIRDINFSYAVSFEKDSFYYYNTALDGDQESYNLRVQLTRR